MLVHPFAEILPLLSPAQARDKLSVIVHSVHCSLSTIRATLSQQLDYSDVQCSSLLRLFSIRPSARHRRKRQKFANWSASCVNTLATIQSQLKRSDNLLRGDGPPNKALFAELLFVSNIDQLLTDILINIRAYPGIQHARLWNTLQVAVNHWISHELAPHLQVQLDMQRKFEGKHEYTIPIPVTTSSPALSPFSLMHMSPLEIALAQLKPHLAPTDSFDEFCCWTRNLCATDTPAFIGTIRSVHLYRESSALHHEYAIISFSDGHLLSSQSSLSQSTTTSTERSERGGEGGEGRTSWLRIERSARPKAHWHHLQLDSSKPLIGGTDSIQRVSFAPNKRDLVLSAGYDGWSSTSASTSRSSSSFPWLSSFSHNDTPRDRDRPSDIELACVTYSDPHTRYLTREMDVVELGDMLSEIAAMRPAYTLLEANCRWFARSILASFAARVGVNSTFAGEANVGKGAGELRCTWMGREVSFEELGRCLGKDPFGGQQSHASVLSALISSSTALLQTDSLMSF